MTVPRVNVALLVTLITAVLAIGRWVGSIEQRVATCEYWDAYEHGDHTSPYPPPARP